MGGPVSLEVAHSAPERVAGVVLASPAGGMHNQPLARALAQLMRDAVRESPRMARVAVPDYLHFGPVNALHLFGELMRFPSLERLLRTPVPTLAVIGSRDPSMPPPWRIQEVGRLAPPHLTIAVIEGAAHAMNFSRPGELAHVIGCWLDGREITDDPTSPAPHAPWRSGAETLILAPRPKGVGQPARGRPVHAGRAAGRSRRSPHRGRGGYEGRQFESDQRRMPVWPSE